MTDKDSRKLFLMRHGERVDFTFGDWVPNCFDNTGKYTRKDLNMPKTLPNRYHGYQAFCNDSPLTRVGLLQAEITGETFKEAGLNVDEVYCSPALRCVQTCDAFLKGCEKRDQIRIKIEPGLFEWTEWYLDGVPKFMTPEEFLAAGYNVDLDYKSYISIADLVVLKETFEEFYARSYSFTKHILSGNQNSTIFVGHSTTLEVCSRELIGKMPRTFKEMARTIMKIPYSSFLQLNQTGDTWQIAEKRFFGITHSGNNKFDPKMLID